MVKCGFINFTVFSFGFKVTLFKITSGNVYGDFGVCFPYIQSLEGILKIFSFGDATLIYFLHVHMDVQVNGVGRVE